MTIEAIVERGTLAIEASPILARSGSPDVVRFGRHLYSDKPPVLSVLASAVYAPLYAAGVRFSGLAMQFVTANLVLTWVVVGLASGLTLVALRQLLQMVPIAPWAADLLTLGFGYGSPLLTYGVTFNNHSVAAALLTWSLALVALADPASLRAGVRPFLVGLLTGLAATIDQPAGGAMLVALGLCLAIRARSVPWAFLAGAGPMLLLHAGLQSLVTGSPLPAEFYPEAFAYPGSYWSRQVGRWTEPGPRWRFGLELLVGPQGWLTVTPVLAFGLVGLALALARRDDPLRPIAKVVGPTVLVLLVYYIWGVRRTDFAGQSFGVRHLLPVAPAVYLFAVDALARLRNHLACLAFALLMAIGVVYAIAGMRDPWSRVENRARRDASLRIMQRGVLYPHSSYARD
jgi:hypothetical protein